MIFSLFRKSAAPSPAEEGYRAIVAQSRQVKFYADWGVPDTVTGRFDMISLHLVLHLRRLRTEPAAKAYGQALVNVFFRDMDHSIRELGVTIARLSIAKHVVIAASQSGKLKTLTQVFALGGFIGPFKHLSGAWEVPGDVVWWVSAVLMGVAVVLTITSGLEFARDAVKQRRAARAVH